MTKPVIVISRPPTEEVRVAFDDYLDEAGEILFIADLDDSGRAAALANASVLVVQNMRVEFTEEELAGFGHIGLVQALTAGIDHVPFSKLPPDLPVAANPGVYADAMAEHVVAMAYAAGKRLMVEHEEMRAGNFNQFRLNRRMAGMTAAILGFGGVGRATARLLRPLGMAVHAVNRSGETDEEVEFIGTMDDLETVLRAAEIVVIAYSLTRKTRGLIDARALSWMKDDAILINVSRGEIIDQTALYERLTAFPDFTACIDAWWVEPVRHGEFRIEHPFLELPNVVASPHNSAQTGGGLVAPLKQAAENVSRFLAGEAPRFVAGDDEKLN